eukprot:scaffold616_cov257-Pinguiococcus_pyrenoidosus.AAC.18
MLVMGFGFGVTDCSSREHALRNPAATDLRANWVRQLGLSEGLEAASNGINNPKNINLGNFVKIPRSSRARRANGSSLKFGQLAMVRVRRLPIILPPIRNCGCRLRGRLIGRPAYSLRKYSARSHSTSGSVATLKWSTDAQEHYAVSESCADPSSAAAPE